MIKKKFTLLDYQLAFQKNLAIAVRDHQQVIACAATGSGKTKTFIDTSAKAHAKGKTILIISESLKIFEQIKEEIEATEIADGKNYKTIQPHFVYLAMAQTLRNRQHLIEQFAALGPNLLVIFDECHMGNGAAILKLFKSNGVLIIGFSATPEGKHLVDIYNHCVVGPQPHDLVLSGDLTPYKHIARQRADIANLRLNSAGDEYTEESQEEVFESDEVYEGLTEDLRVIPFRKCIIYCASIRDCEHTYETLTAAGFICSRIHTRMTKDEQKIEMDKFMGLTPIMINVAILTKGYDYQPIDLIVLKFKTKKLTKYIQCIGRGSRVLDEDRGKPLEQRKKQVFRVLDYGQNHEAHKQWDYEHDWANKWQGKPTRPGVPPHKLCPNCNHLIPNSIKKCPNCGYEFVSLTLDPEPAEQPETVLIEITQPYTQLSGKKLSELSPEELAIYAKTKNKRMYAIRVAKARAQNNDEDFLRSFGAAMGYKWGWAQRLLENMPTDPIEYNDFILR
jgi:superfamily II DNA or RNA helicase